MIIEVLISVLVTLLVIASIMWIKRGKKKIDRSFFLPELDYSQATKAPEKFISQDAIPEDTTAESHSDGVDPELMEAAIHTVSRIRRIGVLKGDQARRIALKTIERRFSQHSRKQTQKAVTMAFGD